MREQSQIRGRAPIWVRPFAAMVLVLRGKGLKQALFLVGAAVVWEVVARSGVYPPLLFPSVSSILAEFAEEAVSGEILRRTYYSLYLIVTGMGVAIVLALAASTVAMTSRAFSEILTALMAIMHPLPGIAVLPVVLLWFGTGPQSIVVVIVFSAVWPLVANIHAGLLAVPRTQIEVGRNLGLKGPRLVFSVMVRGALPYLLAGLRVSWARSWQASVAAEMVFGAAGGEGGLGWLIYKQRFFLEIPGVFAGMLMIILIGLLIERLVFETAERKTVRKWGMSAS